MGAGQAYHIRSFREADLEKVMEINRKCLPENYSSFFFLEIHRSNPEAFLVAEAEGKVVGYVMCRVEHGLSGLLKFKLTRKGHVVSIAVLPEHRLKGLATLLMVKAMENLYDKYACHEVYLEVRVSNDPAIKLYRKLGFKENKTIPHYYIDGEDAFLMVRKLPLERWEAVQLKKPS
ncbi:MAG: ribosomal protein S18-alanine N-acetyltransferase [Candidatus Hecatellaceae archaeon]